MVEISTLPQGMAAMAAATLMAWMPLFVPAAWAACLNGNVQYHHGGGAVDDAAFMELSRTTASLALIWECRRAWSLWPISHTVNSTSMGRWEGTFHDFLQRFMTAATPNLSSAARMVSRRSG